MKSRMNFTYSFPIYHTVIRCYDKIEPHIEIFNENDKHSLT